MVLARERPSGGTVDSGRSGRGLTLFLVPVTRDAEGRPQVILRRASSGCSLASTFHTRPFSIMHVP